MTPQIVGSLYTVILIGLAFYAIHIILLIALYLHHRREPSPAMPAITDAELPVVTVQIPLRNERYVAQRILAAVTAFEWPRDRLDIQVLDDSDDDTTALAQAEVERLRAEGYDIHLLHRNNPQGHKAGALAAGMRQARGTFIAIFDADFSPAPDFLRRMVPYLVHDPTLGFVQARWGHLNAEYSLITRAQALALDAHFTVEHIARNRSGLLMNFNGTGGVWRKQAIEDAGGWQHDTIAEDLDLSYRAQLAGWKVLYLPEVVAPAELPPLVAAFRQQQYRWAKGATQVLRKLSGAIVRSPRLRPAQKVMALLHLSGYFTQPLILALVFLVAPMAIYSPRLPTLTLALGTFTMLPPLLYVLGQAALYHNWPRRILCYPILLLLGVGISWNTTLGVLDGLLHWGGEFKRTPKFELRGQQGSWRDARYRIKLDRALPGEILICIYALAALILAHELQRTNLMPLSLIALAGEVFVVWGALQQLGKHRSKKEQGR
ncbi:MAG TPA: glycosyltransferase family 2 protein [Anaerolineae bacterium]|nr:glycosyltransferase family 2 protein [Anaerolineae bacterium]HQI86429.1 glycosyltransferase family 2 protein [Anaerolineae bacterium]